jgi:hypothetical protein
MFRYWTSTEYPVTTRRPSLLDWLAAYPMHYGAISADRRGMTNVNGESRRICEGATVAYLMYE